MHLNVELQIWLGMTLVSTVVGLLALLGVMQRIGMIQAIQELAPDPNYPIYSAVLKGNFWQQLLRLAADLLSWAAGIASAFTTSPPPPSPNEAATMTGVVLLWTLLGLRITLTLNSVVEYGLHVLWQRSATQQAAEIVAARRRQAASEAGSPPTTPTLTS